MHKNSFLFLLLFTFLIKSCSPKEQPITKKEAIEFAKKLEYTIARRSSNMLDSVLYLPAFARRVANEFGVTYDRTLASQVSSAILKMKFGRETIKSLGKEGTFEFLQHYEKNKRHHIIFRLFADAGLNYYDLELIKFKNQIKAADIFMLTTGENWSKTLAQTMIVFAKHENKKQGKAAVKYLDHLEEIKALIKEKQFENAKKYYDRLPEDFKKEKVFMIMNISICAGLGNDLHKAALVQLESNFPNDASTQLFLMDSYLLDEDYDHALTAVDVIDSAVKIDPLLNFFRGNICSQKEDYAAAVGYYELLKKQKPEFADGIIELINGYFMLGENEKAKNLIVEYQFNKKFKQEKLQTIKSLYPDLVSDL